MTRREFGAALVGIRVAGPPPKRKAPFKVLYSNDTTNILTCVSPYHPRGKDTGFEVPSGWYDDGSEGMTPAMIQATVDEAEGVDAHLLQPGLGWIPWWNSGVYPADEHYHRWMRATGHPLDGFAKFMLEGGDVVQVFVDRCRRRQQAPFVSLRLNDGHFLDNVGSGNKLSVWASRFYEEHPEYRLGPNLKNWDHRVLNWAIREVREHKFSFIREICENYDIDGFELDFMRHTAYFRQSETTSSQRAQVMTDLVAVTRQLLDRTAKPGRRRWLCARVPCFAGMHDAMGIDLPAMVNAGLDMANLSAHYFTTQQTDLAKIRKMIPDATLYLEMTHCTTQAPMRVKAPLDNFSYLRTTDPQFYTGAHLAYRRGADGVSLFNFVYYREHGAPGRGPFNKPPFHVLRRLGDPAWLAAQPQWYVLAAGWTSQSSHLPLPRVFNSGGERTFALDLEPNPRGRDGLFRLRTKEDSSGWMWTVKLNGAVLAPAAYIRKPIEHPYDAALGEANQYACFRVPRGLVREGVNQVSMTLGEGGPATVDYLDLVLP